MQNTKKWTTSKIHSTFRNVVRFQVTIISPSPDGQSRTSEMALFHQAPSPSNWILDTASTLNSASKMAAWEPEHHKLTRKGPSRPWSKSCIPGHRAQPGRLTTNHFPNGKNSCNVSGNGIIEGFAPGWVLPWLAGKAKSKRQRCSGVHGVKHTPKESRDSIFVAFSMLGNCNLQSLETRHDKFLSKPHIFVSSKWKMGLVRRTLWDAAFVCKSWLDLAGTSQSELTIASLKSKSTFQTISWRVRLWCLWIRYRKLGNRNGHVVPSKDRKTHHACKTLVASLTSSNAGECLTCEFLEFSHNYCVWFMILQLRCQINSRKASEGRESKQHAEQAEAWKGMPKEQDGAQIRDSIPNSQNHTNCSDLSEWNLLPHYHEASSNHRKTCSLVIP